MSKINPLILEIVEYQTNLGESLDLIDEFIYISQFIPDEDIQNIYDTYMRSYKINSVLKND